jgi:DNA-binding NarL/FixJ family response regulator
MVMSDWTGKILSNVENHKRIGLANPPAQAASRAAAGEYTPTQKSLPPLTSLLEVLTLLVEQSRAYDRALPANNYPARAAVAMLGELAQQALNEAHELETLIQPGPPSPHPFSPREHEVLGLAAQGLTNKEIAFRLGLSERTVQFHMNSVFNKTGAQSRTEAVAMALRSGWVGW